MSRVISKCIAPPFLFCCAQLRFARFRAASSRMASESSSSPSPSSAIDFLSLCHRLKTTKRAGWVRKEVWEPESIADHMYRMGLMALIASDLPGINREKCIKMAIVHDIAEAIVGDITPADGIPKLEKSRREREALESMCELLGGGPRAKEISDLWMEYEENSSLEAKVVKDFDKVEMILQALEYENGGVEFNLYPKDCLKFGGLAREKFGRIFRVYCRQVPNRLRQSMGVGGGIKEKKAKLTF